MDTALQNALDELRKSGARNLPSANAVEKAANGSRWHGKKKSGDRWYMVKHKPGSYNVEC